MKESEEVNKKDVSEELEPKVRVMKTTNTWALLCDLREEERRWGHVNKEMGRMMVQASSSVLAGTVTSMFRGINMV